MATISVDPDPDALKQRLQRSERRLRSLMRRLHTAQEEERRRLAREVHDVLGQALTAIRMDACWIRDNAESRHPDFDDRMSAMLALVESTIEKVRRMTHELRPGVLDHFGLIAALEWQLEQFQTRSDLECVFEDRTGDRLGDPLQTIDSDLATALFRIFQEAFTNVIRHADASRVTTTVDLEAPSSAEPVLRLSIADDGVGFDPSESHTDASASLGLLHMRERVLPWGGSVEHHSAPGAGTVVDVRVPLGGRGGELP